jgi:hypothetical protein
MARPLGGRRKGHASAGRLQWSKKNSLNLVQHWSMHMPFGANANAMSIAANDREFRTQTPNVPANTTLSKRRPARFGT